MLAVETPDKVPIATVTRSTPKLFDPRMLVRRNSLGSQLSTQPVRFFGKDHAHSERASRHRCGTTSGSSTDNKNVASCFSHTSVNLFQGVFGVRKTTDAGSILQSEHSEPRCKFPMPSIGSEMTGPGWPMWISCAIHAGAGRQTAQNQGLGFRLI